MVLVFPDQVTVGGRTDPSGLGLAAIQAAAFSWAMMFLTMAARGILQRHPPWLEDGGPAGVVPVVVGVGHVGHGLGGDLPDGGEHLGGVGRAHRVHHDHAGSGHHEHRGVQPGGGFSSSSIIAGCPHRPSPAKV